MNIWGEGEKISMLELETKSTKQTVIGDWKNHDHCSKKVKIMIRQVMNKEKM